MSTKHDAKQVMDLVPEEQSSDSRRDIMNILLKNIRDIELQLSCKERTDMTGVKLTPQQYNLWRKKAIKAMNHLIERYRKYKELDRKDREHALTAECKPLEPGDFQRAIAELQRETESAHCDGAGVGTGDELQVSFAPGAEVAPNSVQSLRY